MVVLKHNRGFELSAAAETVSLLSGLKPGRLPVWPSAFTNHLSSREGEMKIMLVLSLHVANLLKNKRYKLKPSSCYNIHFLKGYASNKIVHDTYSLQYNSIYPPFACQIRTLLNKYLKLLFFKNIANTCSSSQVETFGMEVAQQTTIQSTKYLFTSLHDSQLATTISAEKSVTL